MTQPRPDSYTQISPLYFCAKKNRRGFQPRRCEEPKVYASDSGIAASFLALTCGTAFRFNRIKFFSLVRW